MESQFQIRILEASDTMARVEVSCSGNEHADAQLTGAISGPRRQGSRTLPATVLLRPIAKDSTPSAEATLPDPCFWSAEMPFLYDICLELRRGDQVIDTASFCIALQSTRVVQQ